MTFEASLRQSAQTRTGGEGEGGSPPQRSCREEVLAELEESEDRDLHFSPTPHVICPMFGVPKFGSMKLSDTSWRKLAVGVALAGGPGSAPRLDDSAGARQLRTRCSSDWASELQ